MLTLPFRILSGTRLEIFLAFVVLLSIYYSTDAGRLFGRVPFLKKREAKRFAVLRDIHGSAYKLILVILGRITGDLMRWSLVSLAVLILYNVATFFEMPILDDRRVTLLALAVLFGAPLLGLILSVFWVRQLVLELKEFDPPPPGS